MLTIAQKAILMEQRLDEDALFYNLAAKTELSPLICLKNLSDAVNLVLSSSDACRIEPEKGGYIRDIDSRFSLEVLYFNSATEREDWVTACLAEKFDLDQGPLFKAFVTCVGKELMMYHFWHHLAVDGAGFAIYLRRVSDIYYALSQGSNVDELSREQLKDAISAEDIIAKEEAYLATERCAKSREYWLNKFATLPEATFSPRFVHFDEGKYQSLRVSTSLDETFKQQFGQVCESTGFAPAQVWLSALAYLLCQFSGQQKICIGVPSHNRSNVGLKNSISALTSVQPLLVDCERQDLWSLGQQLSVDSKKDKRHSRYPMATLHRDLNLMRQGRQSIYDVMFSYLKFDEENVLGNSQSRFLHNGQSRLPLTVYLEEFSDSTPWVVHFDCNGQYLNAAEVTTLQQKLCLIIERWAQNPRLALSQCDLMDEADAKTREQINRTALAYDNTQTVIGLISEHGKNENADKIALQYLDQSFTFAQLDEISDKIAAMLQAQGVVRGDKVIACFDHNAQLVLSLLAIWKCGAAYVPVDPQYPVERIQYVISDCKATHVLCQQSLKAMFDVMALSAIAPFAEDQTISAVATYIKPEVSSEDLAYLIYTSGSTGNPKGVVISHQNVLNFFCGLEQKIGQSMPQGKGLWLGNTSISFDISVLELFWSLSRADQVVIQAKAPSTATPRQPVKFSLFNFASKEDVGNGQMYDLMLDSAKFADKAGFEAVWVPERHFHPFGGIFANPSVTAAAIAGVTEQINIRAGSVVVPLHHPVRVAEEWAMVDNLSKGRAGIAVAAGWQFNDFVLAPQNYSERLDIMFDNLSKVRRLWAGEKVGFVDGMQQEIDVELFPKPMQQDIPVWVTAAGNPEMFRRAGEMGANILTHLLGHDLEQVKEKIEIYRQARAQAGFDPSSGHVTLMVHTFISDCEKHNKTQVHQPLKQYLAHSLGLLKPLAEEAGLNLEQDKEAILEMAFERYYQTSGLFGTPQQARQKALEIQQAGVDEIACLMDFGIDSAQVMASLAKVAEVKSLFDIEAARDAAAPVSEDIPDIANNIIDLSLNSFQCTPSHLKMLLASPHCELAIAKLKLLLVGGEALPQELVVQIFAINPEIRMFNMYGPTEATVWCAVQQISADTVPRVGPPIANTELYVLNQQCREVPYFFSGELCIGGDCVALGYFERQTLTDERFIPLQLSDGTVKRVYRTGDRVRALKSGEFEFLGRLDNQVKLRGHRIELGEIEKCIIKSGVSDSVCCEIIGREMLVAFVEADGATEQLQQSVQRWVQANLPAIMVPTKVIGVIDWPLTPNGKIDRKQLHQLVHQDAAEQQLVAAQGEVEEQLMAIWQQILSEPRLCAGRSFFEQGGNSLHVATMLNEVHQQLGLEIRMSQFMDLPSIKGLADLINSHSWLHSDAGEEILDDEMFEEGSL
ncbi:MupA/Atu3671 family FMN-dependent luciferase-like monooxygenase [uncultured Shewanella sp.]|uniref:MupA/Atu3671 family FMN-dependent luciferase-like monooxygenase n=1 Tax=uncultured Shewanella sp. TaxID=173975 RepID=UPI002606C1A9|nr:MupA/Atu3671 family FMN-dependent luciferase-like monooxygenase [uncultured Shewanella sp.]